MDLNGQLDAVQTLKKLLPGIVRDVQRHGKWLNSLSFMEHIGATKIARTQSGPGATYMVLKHAAEEARHGFYLKRLARKVWPSVPDNYQSEGLLAPIASRQYLYRLDIAVSRMLNNAGYTGKTHRDLAYLLVTYAIEVRADALYPVYQDCIEDYPVKISVRTIINEEEGHLEEMENALAAYDFDTNELKDKAVEIESELFKNWVQKIAETSGVLQESVKSMA